MAQQITLPNPITIAKNLTTGGVGITQPGPTVQGAVSATEKATTAVPDFLSRLTSGNLWIRIGETVLGLALIIVGLEKMTNLNITGTLGTAAKVLK